MSMTCFLVIPSFVLVDCTLSLLCLMIYEYDMLSCDSQLCTSTLYFESVVFEDVEIT